jgi:Tol biopolymer transport system component
VLSVAVAPGQVTLVLGGQGSALTATLSTSDCPVPPSITWSSSNPDAVAIGGTGSAISISAVGASTSPVTITATAGDKTGSATVTVQAGSGISLSAASVGFVAPTGGADPADRTVIISSTGADALEGLALGPIGYGSAATGWLQGSLSGTSAAPTATLTLRATLGALPPGAYTASVPINSTTPGVAEQTLAVTFIVTAQATGTAMIAFERWTGTSYPSTSGEIWRMDPAGANQVQLTNDATFDGYPVISPDRTRISFTSLRNGNYDLFLMNADGTLPAVLRNSANPEIGSSWSPDGLHLVYEWFFSGTDVDLHVLTLDGAANTILIETPQSEEMPSWSPDGLQIALSRDPAGQGLYAIYRMPAAGGELFRLTNDQSDNFTPAWSPDGTRIAWSSNRGGSYQIYTMDATTGGNVVQLTTAGVNIQPAWSPDGSRIAWASGLGDDWDIWIMNPDGTGKVNITATTATNEAAPSWR